MYISTSFDLLTNLVTIHQEFWVECMTQKLHWLQWISRNTVFFSRLRIWFGHQKKKCFSSMKRIVHFSSTIGCYHIVMIYQVIVIKSLFKLHLSMSLWIIIQTPKIKKKEKNKIRNPYCILYLEHLHFIHSISVAFFSH